MWAKEHIQLIGDSQKSINQSGPKTSNNCASKHVPEWVNTNEVSWQHEYQQKLRKNTLNQQNHAKKF